MKGKLITKKEWKQKQHIEKEPMVLRRIAPNLEIRSSFTKQIIHRSV
jgi:hypothetical protein